MAICRAADYGENGIPARLRDVSTVIRLRRV